MMLLIIAVACLAGAVFLAGEVATLPSRERARSMRRARRTASSESPRRSTASGCASGRSSPARDLRQVGAEDQPADEHGGDLAPAARCRPRTAPRLGFAKGFLAVGGAPHGSPRRSVTGSGLGLLFMGAFGAGGFIAPDYFVSLKAKGRREKIRADLPDALDLLAVCVEAGLGFDGAIAKLTEHMEGPWPRSSA